MDIQDTYDSSSQRLCYNSDPWELNLILVRSVVSSPGPSIKLQEGDPPLDLTLTARRSSSCDEAAAAVFLATDADADTTDRTKIRFSSHGSEL